MQTSKRASVLLWIVQGALAALFLFAGGFKLLAPAAMLQGPIAFPPWFLRFIGLCEISGALGLVLPGIFRVQRGLTPLAAVGLVTIMTGATGLTLEVGMIPPTIVSTAAGLLTLSVVYGRRDWAPLGWSAPRAVARAA